MATRTLLCVEPDEASVGVIRGALEPYGFDVTNIANGEQAIEWARKHTPEAILVCVEPRKVGYAICNKLKRSPDLQNIPVILTSAEETQQTFDQHKKLKSRADEYILKPLTKEALVDKIGPLVRLGGPGGSGPSEEIFLTGDISEEISIAEGDIVEEKTNTVPIPTPPGLRAEAQERHHDGTGGENPFSGGDLDSIFDQETDAAFAAIQTNSDLPALASGDANGAAARSEPSPVAVSAASETPDWEDERTHAVSLSSLFGGEPAAEAAAPPPPPLAPEPQPALAAAEPDAAPVVEPDVAPDVEPDVPSPDEVSGIGPALVDLSSPISVVDKGRIRELEGRIAELEDDRRRLLADAEEMKARLQAQPLSKEKEVLNLREIINRKEKDILDLRDVVDAKDRQVLDSKDRIREHERARRDLEEKMLGMEKSLMGANERVAALMQDKDRSQERERGLKSRLEDALTEIQKTHDEADDLKKRLAATEEKARIDLDRLRGDSVGRITELEDQHRSEIARLSDEKVAAEESLERQYETKILQLRAAHTSELEARAKEAAEELEGANERFALENAKLRREHDKAIASLKEEQAQQLAAERQAHGMAIEAKERDHRNELQGLRRRQEEELRAAEERRQRELAEAEMRRIADLEAAETRRRQELQARDDDHHAKIAEMDRQHFDEKTATAERHRAEMDVAHARAARAEGELAARSEELNEAHRRLSGVNADLDGTRTDLRDREVKLAQARDRIADLEVRVQDYEDQILKAFQKLRADDKVVDRAKRALAVALTLLDERGATPQAPASSPQTARVEESST